MEDAAQNSAALSVIPVLPLPAALSTDIAVAQTSVNYWHI